MSATALAVQSTYRVSAAASTVAVSRTIASLAVAETFPAVSRNCA